MIPREKMKCERPVYQVDDTILKRFPVTRNAFSVVSLKDTGEMTPDGFLDQMMKNLMCRIERNAKGYTQMDNALDMGANALNLIIGNYGRPNTQFLQWSPLLGALFPNRVNMPGQELTQMVKEAASLYGADLVGVAKVDERWIFSSDYQKPFVIDDSQAPLEDDKGFHIPQQFTRAIVMALVMDDDLQDQSPSVPASTAASLGYSRMAITAVSLAEYIRALGFHAIPSMNDTALSIPLAVDAGLGQLGRHGLLITPEYGSNVRLCKVLTDMPLAADEPIDFGVTEFCNNCLLCVQHCPSGSISAGRRTMESEMSTGNSGVLKWYVKGESCLRFWQENGASCGNCIAVCPFTHGFESSHCLECERCELRHDTCVLQDNTDMRIDHGYLEKVAWGGRSKRIQPKRRGL